MADLLSLEKIPEFVSCTYCSDGGEHHTVTSHPEYDTLILVVREQLCEAVTGAAKVNAGRYIIMKAGDGTVLSGEHAEYFIAFFKGVYTPSDEFIPLTGRYDFKAIDRYTNRLLEIRDKRLDGQRVSFIEQEALFCNILSNLYSVGTTPIGEYLAKSIMHDIVENFNKDITLEKLSEKYFYSPNYIIRVFRNKYNITPYRHIIHLRVERAKQLLSSTDKTCQEIADRCGYHDLTTFYKAFVAETGESPEKWRREIKTDASGDYRSSEHAIKGGE